MGNAMWHRPVTLIESVAITWLLMCLSIVSTNSFSAATKPTLIHAIQGAGDTSPLAGTAVTIEAIVVGDFQAGHGAHGNLRGFFVQEEDADADDHLNTSEGLFVYTGASPKVDVNVGDVVQVTGFVKEFYGLTELADVTQVSVLSSGNGLPTPASIALPASSTVRNSDGKLIPDLEAFEGMFVTFTDPLVVTEMYNLDRFGEVTLSQGGRPEQFTQSHRPDVSGFASHQRDVASRRILLDDGHGVQNPNPIIYPDGQLSPTDSLRLGDTVRDLSGVLIYSRGSGKSGDAAYRVHPTLVAPAFHGLNHRPLTPPDVSGPVGGSVDGYLKVASFNVLNFFATLAERGAICGPSQTLDCRGALNALEYNRQLAKLVTAISKLNADVLGVIEIENTTPSSGLAELVAALNQHMGKNTYAYVKSGTIGTDAIRVGLLYKPLSVTPVGGHAILDSTVDPLFLDTKNRPVLLQTFEEVQTKERFSVAVAHLKSKGSSCADVDDPDVGDGQGNCTGVRTAAAVAINRWIDTDPTHSGDPDVLLLGDLNAYANEDPIRVLTRAGWINEVPQAYSYVFDGQTGTLDYALTSSSLHAQVTAAEVWHINADEADALDYNTDYGRPKGIYSPSEYRSSDHDPVVIGLSLATAL